LPGRRAASLVASTAMPGRPVLLHRSLAPPGPGAAWSSA
jgi:hypothetical protein